MDETHLSGFHSVWNRARGWRLRNSISSRYAFNSFFFFLNKRLYDIHVTSLNKTLSGVYSCSFHALV